MPRAGELTYYEQIGEERRQHALGKPFTDVECGLYLMRVGALFKLLPPPPARVLECGCGTGWLAQFLAQSGYQVVATDVAPAAIRLARENRIFNRGGVPEYCVADSESLGYESAFDAVVFFDSLHHSIDELAAIRSAYRALRPGGVCIALEPGLAHHCRSLQAEAEFDVTEKDMPPLYIRRLGRKAGFKQCRIYPHPQRLGRTLYAHRSIAGWRTLILQFRLLRYLALFIFMALRRDNGIVVLKK
jgi:SAM-dependent methyltransferase